MKIAIVQHDIRSNDFSENLEHLETLIDQHPDADMFVLPETFATGFMPEGGVGGSDYTGYDILQWMGTKGFLYDAAVVGSVATKDDAGQLRNRLYFVRPDGKDEYYDKRHLFTFAGETKDYVPGDRRWCAFPAAGVLRFAIPCFFAFAWRLRCHHLRSQLARTASGCLANATEGACHREPVLCDRRKPCG